jgi:DNA-binding LacI/PurR family transcriptional regulator
MRRPTIKDVARLAGVGIGTVSRVLNDSGLVSEGTRERVMAAVETLDFRPNRFARNLPLKTRVSTLGVLLPTVSGHSFVDRLRGVQMALSAAVAHGQRFDLQLFNVDSPRRYAAQVLDIAAQRMLDGLLFVALPLSAEQERALNRAHIPFVCIGDMHEEAAHSLRIDNEHGGWLATRHLIELGHRRIAYIGDVYPDPFGFHTSQDRVSGYRRALAEAGITDADDRVYLGEFGRDAAERLATFALSRANRPTAIFAMSDVQALGCIGAARALGLRVPEDVSIIGFDDIEIAYYAGLTTVCQHLELSGLSGMRTLIGYATQAAQGLPLVNEQPPFPPLELIVRRTTAAAP